MEDVVRHLECSGSRAKCESLKALLTLAFISLLLSVKANYVTQGLLEENVTVLKIPLLSTSLDTPPSVLDSGWKCI